MKRMMMAVAVMAALAVGARAQGYSYGAGPVEDDYKWSFELAQPVADRDVVSIGLCWIVDDVNRDESTTETTVLSSSVTGTDPDTGIEYTTVTETPHTTTNTVEGADYSGLGIYAVTPLFRFDAFKASAGAVVPLEDWEEIFPAVTLGYTFRGLEAGDFVISSFEIGAGVVFKDEAMYAFTLGLVW